MFNNLHFLHTENMNENQSLERESVGKDEGTSDMCEYDNKTHHLFKLSIKCVSLNNTIYDATPS